MRARDDERYLSVKFSGEFRDDLFLINISVRPFCQFRRATSFILPYFRAEVTSHVDKSARERGATEKFAVRGGAEKEREAAGKRSSGNSKKG